MKWARLRALASSPVVSCGWVWVGRNFEIREKKDCCAGGGRLRIDLPGVGIVTAEEEGAQEEVGEAMVSCECQCELVMDEAPRPTLKV